MQERVRKPTLRQAIQDFLPAETFTKAVEKIQGSLPALLEVPVTCWRIETEYNYNGKKRKRTVINFLLAAKPEKMNGKIHKSFCLSESEEKKEYLTFSAHEMLLWYTLDYVTEMLEKYHANFKRDRIELSPTFETLKPNLQGK